jgi:hypothetical protein
VHYLTSCLIRMVGIWRESGAHCSVPTVAYQGYSVPKEVYFDVLGSQEDSHVPSMIIKVVQSTVN